MKIASIAPGWVVGGIGHGVQSWMEQMGVATASPLTTPEEVIATVRQLLRGGSWAKAERKRPLLGSHRIASLAKR